MAVSVKKIALCGLVALALAGCGGGSSGSATAPVATSLAPSSQYAQQCAPDNPYRGDASSSTTLGSLTLEKRWIRSYFDESYLWYDSVPAVDASLPAFSGHMALLDQRQVPQALSNYFEALKTKLLAPSGAPMDRFSFTYPTRAWNQLSQSGVTLGYGIEWLAFNSTAPNRLWRVAMVQPNSPAAIAGIMRGDTLKAIDGVDFANGSDTSTLNAALAPTAGTSHAMVFARSASADFTATLAGAEVVIDPVPLVSVVTDPLGRKVGYLHFTDHIASSELKLIDAVRLLKAANVTDLVLDLRYNGGGYLYIASELAYMIAGPNRVAGKFFEKLQYNARRNADNAQPPTPFFDTSCVLDATGFCTHTQTLPTLDLRRVFVIATSDTCSASESVINGLLGVDVDVQLIGSRTCGKPYGFIARDNCGVSYFPIEFRGTNFKDFGDYPDGFAPSSASTSNTDLPGCAASDDLNRPLGNTSERMLSTALQRAAYGSCPAGLALLKRAQQPAQPVARLQRSAARELRVLQPRVRAP